MYSVVTEHCYEDEASDDRGPGVKLLAAALIITIISGLTREVVWLYVCSTPSCPYGVRTYKLPHNRRPARPTLLHRLSGPLASVCRERAVESKQDRDQHTQRTCNHDPACLPACHPTGTNHSNRPAACKGVVSFAVVVSGHWPSQGQLVRGTKVGHLLEASWRGWTSRSRLFE